MPLKLYPNKRKWWARGWIQKRYIRRSTGFDVKGGAGAKEGARRRAAEIEVEVRNQAHGWTKKATPTLAKYWRTVYEPVYTAKKRSARVDRYMMAHALKTSLGTMPLDTIKRSDCERYLNSRRADVYGKLPKRTAEGTVQRERSFLAAVFEKAKHDGHIAVNPWRGIKATPYAVRERLVTPAIQAELMNRLSPQFQRWVRFLLGTGLRLAESCGIDPATDLDLERRRVTVTGKFGKVRTVPLPAVLVPVLRTQLEEMGQLWPQDQSTLRAVLIDACAAVAPGRHANQYEVGPRTQLPRISPHDLRHTFGHRYLIGGGDIYTLSKILGHADIKTTTRHYGHLLAEDIQAKADRVELGL